MWQYKRMLAAKSPSQANKQESSDVTQTEQKAQNMNF